MFGTKGAKTGDAWQIAHGAKGLALPTAKAKPAPAPKPKPMAPEPAMSSASAVSMGEGGLPPIASKPPSVQGLDAIGGGGDGGGEGAGAHAISGPVQGRSNLGARIPPSLAALLKVRVY